MSNVPILPGKWRNQCHLCTRVFDRPSRLRKHIQVHESLENSEEYVPKVYGCTECSYTTKRKFCLTSHMRTHTGERYKCKLCNKSFLQQRTVMVHMRRDHTGERPYTCSYCDETFFASYTLRSHIEKKHSKEPVKRKPHKFRCTQCSYTTDRRHRLTTHIQKKHATERPYKCDICGNTFAKRSYLMYHIRNMHKGERPFACSFCDLRFASSLTLQSHAKKCQSEGKSERVSKQNPKQSDLKHRCTQCFFSTFRKSSLNSHMRTHMGKVPYKCEFCNKVFSLKGTVMAHLRNIHNIQSLYVCPSCDKMLYSLAALNTHVEINHHEEFKHACASCDRRYSSAFSLRSHINRDHSEDFEYTCSFCNQRFRTPTGLQRHVNNRHYVKKAE